MQARSGEAPGPHDNQTPVDCAKRCAGACRLRGCKETRIQYVSTLAHLQWLIPGFIHPPHPRSCLLAFERGAEGRRVRCQSGNSAPSCASHALCRSELRITNHPLSQRFVESAAYQQEQGRSVRFTGRRDRPLVSRCGLTHNNQ